MDEYNKKYLGFHAISPLWLYSWDGAVVSLSPAFPEREGVRVERGGREELGRVVTLCRPCFVKPFCVVADARAGLRGGHRQNGNGGGSGSEGGGGEREGAALAAGRRKLQRAGGRPEEAAGEGPGGAEGALREGTPSPTWSTGRRVDGLLRRRVDGLLPCGVD